MWFSITSFVSHLLPRALIAAEPVRSCAPVARLGDVGPTHQTGFGRQNVKDGFPYDCSKAPKSFSVSSPVAIQVCRPKANPISSVFSASSVDKSARPPAQRNGGGGRNRPFMFLTARNLYIMRQSNQADPAIARSNPCILFGVHSLEGDFRSSNLKVRRCPHFTVAFLLAKGVWSQVRSDSRALGIRSGRTLSS
jgi:hypothetical protein